MKIKVLFLTLLLASVYLPAEAKEYDTDSIIFERPQTSVTAQSDASDSTSAKVYNFNDSEREILLRIGEAEAGDQGPEGIALVMNVVLNRVNDYRFPNAIEAVVFQPYQFSPVSNGSYWYKTPGQDCYTALEMVEDGWDESYGSLYFCEGWFSFANYVRSYKSHNFFR